MGDNTKIEWTDASWSPVTGCSRVSPGCDNCYMFAQWPRLHGMNVPGYEGAPDEVALHEDRLAIPGKWKRPRKIFVCSMSDLFHPKVPFEFVARVFDAMRASPQHTFQVLTKRPGRMAYFAKNILLGFWPSNVWAGTSVESAKYLPRLDVLAQVPARVRFVSAEPLLGPLDLRDWLEEVWVLNRYSRAIHWCITGGESGPRARPMHPDWPKDIRDQCQEAGVPFFFKQHGEWIPFTELTGQDFKPIGVKDANRRMHLWGDEADGNFSMRIGRKAAGALLDGVEYREFPGV